MVSSYTNFQGGVMSRGIPADMQALGTSPFGNIYFVDSGHAAASNDNSGKKPSAPLLTIVSAVSKCTASQGDVIVVAEGHTETIIAAGTLTLSVAGISLVGMGRGSGRPTINFTTAVGASVLVTAANVRMTNFLFTGGIDALTNPIHIQAADFGFYNCETRDVTGQATDWIVTTDAADRLHIKDWKHLGAAAAGADTAISIVGTDDIIVEDFEIYGNFAVAAIEQVTTLGNRHRYGGGAKPCFIWTENAADVAITLKADTTGSIIGPINAMLQDNAANVTEAFVGAAAQFFQPIRVVNLAGESSMETNITATTDA
jgi:hypothetical protein